jgi:hypothetical protein
LVKNINGKDPWSVFQEVLIKQTKISWRKWKKPIQFNGKRLYAYLRLNLSSKEIAPLLNISVRSVEIKDIVSAKKWN